MVKQLTPYTKKYLLYMILAPISVIFEVLLEIRIPYYMSKIVDVGIGTGDMDYVLRTGGMMVLMALLGLCFGATSSRFASMAGMGFGSELRRGCSRRCSPSPLPTWTNSAPPPSSPG